MIVEADPVVARGVAANLTSAMSGLDAAAIALYGTTGANGTSELAMGIPLLTGEIIQEVGLVVTILENLAASVADADAFSGAPGFFTDQARDALAQLVGSLSDGQGDFGGGTAGQRVDRLEDEIWPDGAPAELSPEEYVHTLLTDPRTQTLTPDELAAIWPTLPAAGREQFAADEPVAVLDLVVDGGIVLTDAELDAASSSIIANPPTIDIEVDPALAALLDDAAAGASVSHERRVGAAIERADILIAAGEAGREFRDAENYPVTYISLVVGLQAGGTPHRTDDGLIVVVVPRGSELSVNDVLGGEGGRFRDIDFQPYGNGGTTYGNTFIVPARRDGAPHDADLLNHENIHTYQWAGAGVIEFPVLYVREAVESGVRDLAENSSVEIDVDAEVDVEVVTVDPPPIGPESTGGWRIPGTDWHVPSVDLPQVDAPPIPVGVDIDVDVDVDVETEFPFNTGCTNRFEQHADLDDGNYHSCTP